MTIQAKPNMNKSTYRNKAHQYDLMASRIFEDMAKFRGDKKLSEQLDVTRHHLINAANSFNRIANKEQPGETK